MKRVQDVLNINISSMNAAYQYSIISNERPILSSYIT